MRYLLPLSIIVLLLPSCFLGHQKAADQMHVDELALADVKLVETKLTLGREGKEPIRLEAESIKWFENEHRVVIENLELSQNDREGNLFITGKADQAEIDTKSMVASLKGNVHLVKEDDRMEIEAESLELDTEESRVTAAGTVTISLEDGYLIGRQLEADLLASTLELSEIEKGVMYEK
ncbi:MAG: LPS export ABC transporter periplasmic protein LptC [Spirochaetales bacterium]|nr:LPS export ABC transporter periplasmic protein LptC [Spirochaetales bacterium]